MGQCSDYFTGPKKECMKRLRVEANVEDVLVDTVTDIEGLNFGLPKREKLRQCLLSLL